VYPLQPNASNIVGTAWILSGVLSALRKEASAKAPLETGGILLGYWSELPATPVVTHWIGPGPTAIHEQGRFVPDYNFHEFEVARLYRESSGFLQYLGDWHSHPGSPGYLSQRDCRTLRRIASFGKARAPRPLMVVLAFGPDWDPVVWSGRKRLTCVWPSFVLERWLLTAFSSSTDCPEHAAE
jgi:Predicted metal-dependent protease of the PAD1/JAB1 superfamily